MTKGGWKQSQPAKLHRDDHGFKMPAGFRNPFNDYQTAGGEICVRSRPKACKTLLLRYDLA